MTTLADRLAVRALLYAAPDTVVSVDEVCFADQLGSLVEVAQLGVETVDNVRPMKRRE